MDFCGGDVRMTKEEAGCRPGEMCFVCTHHDCVVDARYMEKEEGEMLRRAKEKGSGEGATSTKPVNKTSMYIIPQLRHMKPVAQNEARTYKIPKDCIEMWLRSVYGLKCQPVVAPLKDKAKFRREIAKESGLYVDC